MSELEIWTELGNIYCSSGAYDEAIRTYQKVIALDPDCNQSYVSLAELLVRQGRYSEAIPVFQKGIDHVVGILDKAHLWKRLGNAYAKLEDWPNAGECFRKAQQLNPDDDSIRDLLTRSDPAQVLPKSQTAPTVDQEIDEENPEESLLPKDPACQEQKPNGISATVTEEEESQADYSEEIVDTNREDFLPLAIAYWHKKENEKALELLENGLNQQSESLDHYQQALCHLAQGRVLSDMGKLEDAIQSLQKAAELAPDRIFPWRDLGDLNCRLGNYERARDEYQRAVDHDPKDASGWTGLGETYHRIGLLEEAISAYQRGLALAPLVQGEDLLQAYPQETKLIDEAPQCIEPEDPGPNSTILKEPVGKDGLKVHNDAPKAILVGPASESKAIPSDDSKRPSKNGDTQPISPYWIMKSEPANWNLAPYTASQVQPQNEANITSLDELPVFTLKRPSEADRPHKEAWQDPDQDAVNSLIQLSPRRETADGLRTGKALSTASSNQVVNKESGILASTSGKSRNPSEPSTRPLSVDSDIDACRKVTEINPANDRAWDALGCKYEAAGLYNEAIAAYEQAIALAPRKEVYYYHQGIALGYLAHYEKAIQALEMVLAINPSYNLAHCALAGYYRRIGDSAQSEAHGAIARPSMEYESDYNQACFESICGDADRAIELLTSAVQKKQVHAELLQNDPDLDFIRSDPRFLSLLSGNSGI